MTKTVLVDVPGPFVLVVTAYAYFVQNSREEHRIKHPAENLSFSDFSKTCLERWKTLTDDEKKPFEELAEIDEKRYQCEMKVIRARGNKRRQSKDPNTPKLSLSAFFWFCQDERGKVKQDHPDLCIGEISKELRQRWLDADPEVWTKYELIAAQDKARYEKEMTDKKKTQLTAATFAQRKIQQIQQQIDQLEMQKQQLMSRHPVLDHGDDDGGFAQVKNSF